MFENPYVWILIIIIIAVAIPVIGHIIRKRDFERQVSGKKPERNLKNDPSAYSTEEHVNSREVDLRKLDIQQRSKGNSMGL